VYDGIPYQVKQGAGDRGITAVMQRVARVRQRQLSYLVFVVLCLVTPSNTWFLAPT